jgi:hypothetical protein
LPQGIDRFRRVDERPRNARFALNQRFGDAELFWSGMLFERGEMSGSGMRHHLLMK